MGHSDAGGYVDWRVCYFGLSESLRHSGIVGCDGQDHPSRHGDFGTH